ncbi:hypothetical protein [Nocardia sp. NPDC059239]|uniref:hypothetical protein n=1 Tax=Nocardia sp. NPDC059239 TaxID=3346785 RepID=UPI0036BAD554
MAAIAASTVRRILAEDVLKPWQYQSWVFIRDPDFATKAARVLDLYQRVFDNTPLDSDEYVISSDEKTSIQARCRCHPTLQPGVSRTMRVNHEYDRGGSVSYLAAYDVHHAPRQSVARGQSDCSDDDFTCGSKRDRASRGRSAPE